MYHNHTIFFNFMHCLLCSLCVGVYIRLIILLTIFKISTLSSNTQCSIQCNLYKILYSINRVLEMCSLTTMIFLTVAEKWSEDKKDESESISWLGVSSSDCSDLVDPCWPGSSPLSSLLSGHVRPQSKLCKSEAGGAC